MRAVLILIWPCTTLAQPQVDKIEDLRTRAVEVRSINSGDEDFSDLEPLGRAIGDARIVQLGEATHGSGATFAAKVRLIKFLHRELGFDVLLWESGVHDVRAVNDALGEGSDPAVAARLGISPIWAWSEEVAPLFEYARDSHAGNRPLEMAGFDLRFSGSDIDALEADLHRFIAELQDRSRRDSVTALIHELAEGYRRLIAQDVARDKLIRDLRRSGADNAAIGSALGEWEENRKKELAPAPADLQRFLTAADAVLKFLSAERSCLTTVHDEQEVAFMERVVDNLRIDGSSQYERRSPDRTVEGPEALAPRNRAWNRRDARMADNLRWLAKTKYPDRKLIVWAHNGHIINAHYYPDWTALSHEPVDEGMKPMGAYLAERMGDAVYTIGFTAFTGQYGYANQAPNARRRLQAPDGSVEAILHQLGYDNSFVDFRGLPPGHWLRQPASMGIRGYTSEEIENWTRVVDGIFFIDRMTPASRIEWQ